MHGTVIQKRLITFETLWVLGLWGVTLPQVFLKGYLVSARRCLDPRKAVWGPDIRTGKQEA